MSTHTCGSSERRRFFLLIALGIYTPAALASYVGGDPPPAACPACQNTASGASGGSLTEGNFTENAGITQLQSGTGPTLKLNVAYNSFNADGSQAGIDTVLGYGWTHSYNALLFSQVQSMFLMGGDGRIEKFQYGAGGSYTADTGYFDTLVKNGDGSFTVTDKYKTASRFAMVPGTSFAIGGPVYRLQSTTDRNGNATTFTYTGGELTAVTDTYGRALHYTYNASGHLTQVTDPMGRTTTFTYDSTGRQLSDIIDPTGRTNVYTYNSLHQMTSKVDGDGRKFTYQYQNNQPVGTEDGSATPLYKLSNPANWSTSPTELAETQKRVYTPSTTTKVDGRGNTWTYQYESHGYLTQNTAPDGSTTRYTYDPGTLKVATQTDADGHTTLYQYDTSGDRLSITDPLGNVTRYTYEPVFHQLTSTTDPNGRVTTYSYDAHGNRTLMTDPLGQTESWTYDSHGNMTSVVNKLGNVTQYQYDASGDLVKTTDALGHITTYAYDPVGNRTNAVDANAHVTRYVYDGDNRLIKTIDALGNTNTTTYDADGDVLSRTDANSHTTSYTYDLRDRLVATTNALNGLTRTSYDTNNNVLTRMDENGQVTTYAYDGQNRRITETDALGNVTRTTYDPVGNTTTVTDANGHTTAYGYDALNRQITVTDPLGNITTYAYATVGGMPCCGATAGSALITSIIDANGKYTYYHYDELNRRYQIVRKSGSTTDTIGPNDAVTTLTYDAENNVLTDTDPNNNTTTMTYDPLNRQSSMTDAAGDVSSMAYDPVGNLAQTTDPRGNVTIYVYDPDNRLLQITDTVGPVRDNAYDPAGNLIETTTGNGNVTTTTYDALNRVTEVIDPLSRTTTTTYDAAGNVLEVTDRNGNTTTYAYDAVNRRITTLDPLGHTTTTAYDAVGNVLSTTDPLGHVTTYMYDGDNRRIRETYPDTPSDTRTYGYDATGHQISRLDQNGQTTTYHYSDFYYLTNRQYTVGLSDQYTYDLGGRTNTATRGGSTVSFTYDGANRPLTAVQNGQTVTYSYNIPAGIRTITYPSGLIVTENYDLRSRLSSVNDGSSPDLSQFTYDFDNNLLSRSSRNGTVANYTYNANDWITKLIHSLGPNLVDGYGYAYDHEGNRLYQMNQGVPGDSESYLYDGLYRLTNFDVGTLSGGIIPSPIVAEGWLLDAVGNWSSFIKNSVTQTRTHNGVNEITAISGSPNPLYDNNGNLLNDGLYAYVYDGENRLTSVTRDSDTVLVGQYTYDALGRHITAIVNPAGTPATSEFIYDGGRLIEQQDGLGTPLADFTFGHYVDEVLTMARDGQIYYYHPNSLGSAAAITDSTGNAVERYTYDAYGLVTITDGAGNPLPLNTWGTPHSAITNLFFFTGRELDEESGLYYYRARYYNAVLGRFLQRDPVEADINLYQYCYDNPLNLTDPSGLAAFNPDIEVITAGKKTDDCGGYSYKVKWKIPAAHDKEAGWIIQMVSKTIEVTDCDGKPVPLHDLDDPKGYPFWEAWEFTKGGEVWVGPASGKAAHSGDTFSDSGYGDCTKGKKVITGEVKAIPGFALPADMKVRDKPPAWSLPYTKTEPAAYKDAPKGAAHTLTAEWNCCPKGKKPTEVTTNP